MTHKFYIPYTVGAFDECMYCNIHILDIIHCFKNLEDSREFTISSRIVYIRDTSGLENKAPPFFHNVASSKLKKSFF